MRNITRLIVSTLLAGLAVPALVSAQSTTSKLSSELTTKVAAMIDQDESRLVGIFKDIHQHPELGFMETRTAGIVANEFKSLGFEVKTGIAKTGVVGILKNGAGPIVMYRADMDANAVEEATGLPYASKVRVKRADGEVPVGHMCGHDAHVTWMLGLAKAMVALKGEWSGTLILVAQPAEELIEGAQAMIDDGFYIKYAVPVPDYLFGLHTVVGPTGKVASRSGVIEAGTDQLDVTFFGVSAHGSTPFIAKDPVVMAASAIMQYQTVVSRVVDPREMAVLTVGSVQAGADNNTIPGSALLKLNLRYYDLKVREQMLASIRTINSGVAKTYGMSDDKMPTIKMKGYAPPLVNDVNLIKRTNIALSGLIGEKNIVIEFSAATGSEDAHLLKGKNDKIPVAYMLVGIVEPTLFEQSIKAGKPPFSQHGPTFKVDLAAIPLGAKVGTVSVLGILAK